MIFIFIVCYFIGCDSLLVRVFFYFFRLFHNVRIARLKITPNGLQLKEVGVFSSNALAESDISPTTNFSVGQKTANFF